MDRTDAPDNVDGAFVEPDEQTATLGTEIAAKFLNNTEESIVRVIEAAGITPRDGTDADESGYDQLLQAIRIIAGGQAAAGKNLVANGGFSLWRRSLVDPPSFTLTGPQYTADRWYFTPGAGGTATVARADAGAGLGVAKRAGRYYFEWGQTVAGTSPRLETRLELLEELDDQQVTFSFWLLSAAGAKDVVPYVRQSFGAGGSAAVEVLTPTVTVVAADGWTKFSVTVTLSSVAGKTVGAGAYTAFGLEGPSGITFGIGVAAFQVEYGDTATEFALEDPGELLRRCGRYFQTTYPVGTPLLTVSQVGAISCDETGAAMEGLNWSFPVQMRATPTVVLVSPRTAALNNVERAPGADAAVTSLVNTSSRSLGVPATAGTTTGAAYAHAIADAEL